MNSSCFLHAAVGKTLTRYAVDLDQAALEPVQTLELPAGLQYLWRHATLPVFYAACSDGRPGFDGSRHLACALKIGADGKLALHGPIIELPLRPVHITADPASRYVFVTYPYPSVIDVFRVEADGALGAQVPQEPMPDLPKTAHQLRVTADGRRAVVPFRGNEEKKDKAEDPGGMVVFDFDNGKLTRRQTLAPDGGRGFGPRHVDFHPSGRWMYMSVERQNQLALFDMGAQVEGPRCRISTLVNPQDKKPRQLGGAIHVHPDGKTVYVSNRADGTVKVDGRDVFNDGDNSIAVFAIDADNGMPSLVQHIDSAVMHARTFDLDASGKLLVTAGMHARTVLEHGSTRDVPAGLALFRIRPDGTLSFVRKYDVEVGNDLLFWAGFSPV